MSANSYAFIGGGIVIGVIEITGGDPSVVPVPDGESLVACGDANPSPGWTYAGGVFTAPTPSPTDEVRALYLQHLRAGLAVTSTATSGLNATYAVEPAAQSNLAMLLQYFATLGVFPSGGPTVQFADITGALHTFTQPQLQSLAAVVGVYFYGLFLTATVLGGGGSANWPTASATIP